MTDPHVKNSEEASQSILQKAFHTDLELFEYLDLPEHTLLRKQFAKTMTGGHLTQPSSSVLAGA